MLAHMLKKFPPQIFHLPLLLRESFMLFLVIHVGKAIYCVASCWFEKEEILGLDCVLLLCQIWFTTPPAKGMRPETQYSKNKNK